MVFLKSVHAATAVTSALVATLPRTLNMNDTTSIKGVAKTLAAGTMSYYSGTAESFADLPAPYYWWECGAMMGAMLDYSHYSGDTQYDRIIARALADNMGDDLNLMPKAHYGDLGNDDQAIWGISVLTAAERNFPQPDANKTSWLQLGENIFDSLSSRWDTTTCGGGLLWQIFASNPNGLHYKNSVANGGLFQIAARLARATGNETYQQWAEKVWDWTAAVHFMDDDLNIYDGADISDNCAGVSGISFSYTQGIYLYGAAVMANYTGDQKWADRATKLLEASKSFYGGPDHNMTNVMYEHACEQVGTCNTDMKSFKGYLSRFTQQAAIMLPSLIPNVDELMTASAAAAANACTGGEGSSTCGQKWYVGDFDGVVGLGQQMSALETVQGLLARSAAPPLKGDQIRDVRDFSSPATSSTPSAPSATASPTKRDNAASAVGLDMRLIGLTALTAALLWGMA
ncbi:glycoside hydrolase family 76 protein [Thozetella sp. PMI_491]|nr:glycoside hydrolase family 76 protein [Thozetella sp. PMI_491]